MTPEALEARLKAVEAIVAGLTEEELRGALAGVVTGLEQILGTTVAEDLVARVEATREEA